MDELLAIVATPEFEEDGHMRVAAVRWTAESIRVQFDVEHGIDDEWSSWELVCADPVDWLFTDVVRCGLNIRGEEHPVVRQHAEPRAMLHFARPTADAHRVIGELWTAHRALTDDWIPFDRYLNAAGLRMDELLTGGMGLLADGPRLLIDVYAGVLEAHGCRPTTRSGRAKRRKGLAMAHFAESYVVAREFSARRLCSSLHRYCAPGGV